MKEIIKKNSITDILEALGEKPQADELYICISNENISENPFPYPFDTDSYNIMIILSGSAKSGSSFMKNV
ncbi:hypothetical protein [Flavobacterium chungangense]|uniref:hypothetical protein n=1 Tax=Flavobacterium chungangense TaxID=554283 RepID=UPI0004DFB6C3|nr:hypothetical protein [Flavobacterium chungangense]